VQLFVQVIRLHHPRDSMNDSSAAAAAAAASASQRLQAHRRLRKLQFHQDNISNAAVHTIMNADVHNNNNPTGTIQQQQYCSQSAARHNYTSSKACVATIPIIATAAADDAKISVRTQTTEDVTQNQYDISNNSLENEIYNNTSSINPNMYTTTKNAQDDDSSSCSSRSLDDDEHDSDVVRDDDNFINNDSDEEEDIAEAAARTAYYGIRVNPHQNDRCVDIDLTSMRRPHMRAFHLAWMCTYWIVVTMLVYEYLLCLCVCFCFYVYGESLGSCTYTRTHLFSTLAQPFLLHSLRGSP
jgi:hypothetical protein